MLIVPWLGFGENGTNVIGLSNHLLFIYQERPHCPLAIGNLSPHGGGHLKYFPPSKARMWSQASLEYVVVGEVRSFQ